MGTNSSPNPAIGDLTWTSQECCAVPGLRLARGTITIPVKQECAPTCIQAICVRAAKQEPAGMAKTVALLVLGIQFSIFKLVL
jgi:hypothetical protein